MRKFLICLFTFLTNISLAQKEFLLDTARLNINTSLRGLSAVNDSVIWISGSRGFIGRSVDGGKNFERFKISGFDSLDYRDIEAFDEQTAIVMSIGSPAYIFRTNDGGQKWKLSFYKSHKDVFLDGMVFWDDKKGIAFGDPIEGKLFIIKTEDGGKSWKENSPLDCPFMQEGEAGFAASGTSIHVTGDGYAFIGTGGKAAHLFTSADYGKSWKKFSCPIIKFKPSTGIFSLTFRDARTGMVIGGDYENDTLTKDNFFLTFNGGKSWQPSAKPPGGYRSCIKYMTQTWLIATGTSGTDISYDGGNTWKNISSVGFHVAGKGKKGKVVYLAGTNGLIGILKQ